MSRACRISACAAAALALLGLASACPWDNTLREYLSARFWLPFAKQAASFERPGVRRASAAFAGMTAVEGSSPLENLRAAYQTISEPQPEPFDVAELRSAIASARADRSLSLRDKEEVALIDAKVDLRVGQPNAPESIENARTKLEAFLRTARTPALRSEARGWLARTHYLLGNQTAAGKIYLDELNRDGSNLSRDTLLNSLQMTYGYDGGPRLLADLEEYFDTPEHAAFAIQLATNPRWTRWSDGRYARPEGKASAYPRIRKLLETHRALLESNSGANALALLAMRTALRMGDPAAAGEIAEAVAAGAAIRAEPDFQWMLASARFLTRKYAEAETPLLALFRSPRASRNQKAAAAYALCGVYARTGNMREQLRFALWLQQERRYVAESAIEDLTVYWNCSGWDLNLLLEALAPVEDLQAFVAANPTLAEIRIVQYALAVRLTRDDRYREAAAIYEQIHAVRRAPRVRQLAALYEAANRAGATGAEKREARYRMAEFLGKHSTGIYYNDSNWSGMQNYALDAEHDARLTRAERESLITAERKLRDEQEEYWRAYLMLREVVREEGRSELGLKAARLAVRCLRTISRRFGREDEIARGDRELSAWISSGH